MCVFVCVRACVRVCVCVSARVKQQQTSAAWKVWANKRRAERTLSDSDRARARRQCPDPATDKSLHPAFLSQTLSPCSSRNSSSSSHGGPTDNTGSAPGSLAEFRLRSETCYFPQHLFPLPNRPAASPRALCTRTLVCVWAHARVCVCVYTCTCVCVHLCVCVCVCVAHLPGPQCTGPL